MRTMSAPVTDSARISTNTIVQSIRSPAAVAMNATGLIYSTQTFGGQHEQYSGAK
jgi:hypothetical protein